MSESSWIDTKSRKIVNFLNIEHGSIRMDDIATGLSNTCRFAGQIEEFYSVAEHSVLVYRYCKSKLSGLSPDLFLSVLCSALMHDAPEAYLGDVTTPLKMLCPGFKIIESELEGVVRDTFGLETPFDHHMIKTADRALFEIERFEFRGGMEYETKCELPGNLMIRNLSPFAAKVEFLACVKELGIQRLSPEDLAILAQAPR